MFFFKLDLELLLLGILLLLKRPGIILVLLECKLIAFLVLDLRVFLGACSESNHLRGRVERPDRFEVIIELSWISLGVFIVIDNLYHIKVFALLFVFIFILRVGAYNNTFLSSVGL